LIDTAIDYYAKKLEVLGFHPYPVMNTQQRHVKGVKLDNGWVGSGSPFDNNLLRFKTQNQSAI
jgi:hypothetical protein